jgi:hypothetical protein
MDAKFPADAVLFRKGRFSAEGTVGPRQLSIRGAFASILGSRALWTSDQPNLGNCLVTKGADKWGRSLLFPPGHPLAGEDRYVWYTATQDPQGNWVLIDRIDSFWDADRDLVLIGWLRPDPAADPRLQRQIIAVNQERLDAARTPEARRRRLDGFLEIGHISPEEHAAEVERQELPAVPEPETVGNLIFPPGWGRLRGPGQPG